jgi:hypothetical protein
MSLLYPLKFSIAVHSPIDGSVQNLLSFQEKFWRFPSWHHFCLFVSGWRAFNSFLVLTGLVWSRDSAVGITTAHRLDGIKVGVRVPVAARFFSMSSRPFLGPTQPLSHWVPGVTWRGVKLATQEYMDLYIHSPIRLHGVVHN